MSDKRLEEIRKRAEAATKGPWVKVSDLPSWAVAAGDTDVVGTQQRRYRLRGSETHGNLGSRRHDAEFIAHAREDIPHLLSLLAEAKEALEDAVEGMETMVDDLAGAMDHGHAPCKQQVSSAALYLADARAALAKLS